MAEAEVPFEEEKEDNPQTNKLYADKSVQISNDQIKEFVSKNSGDDCEPSPSCSHGKIESKSPIGEKRKLVRTITFGRRCKSKGKEGSKKRKGSWNFKLNCCRLRKNMDLDIPEPNISCTSCVCTGYRRTEEHHLGAGIIFETTPPPERRGCFNQYGKDYGRFTADSLTKPLINSPVVDLNRFIPTDYPTEDWDERARIERAREIEEGIDPPPGFQPSSLVPYVREDLQLVRLAASFQRRLAVNMITSPIVTPAPTIPLLIQRPTFNRFEEMYIHGAVHTQIDYIHCLVPDLLEITNCSFYWGKMDRYEAEKLLDNKQEGTFLLRDSAQEEYLFSVSFRRYGRSLHARIEQWNHKFSFDSHDPGVFASDTVCGLIEHYKDPSCCMFFEPMLTIPLHRTWVFSLQHLCRAVICKNTAYDGVNQLHLPKPVKSYLKEYHYKQRVRVRRFEAEQ